MPERRLRLRHALHLESTTENVPLSDKFMHKSQVTQKVYHKGRFIHDLVPPPIAGLAKSRDRS